MIYSAPATIFAATLENAATGLLPAGITVRVVEPISQTILVPSSSVGIVEYPVGSGTYTVERTAPVAPDQYLVVWQIGTDTFTEELVVTATGAPSGPPTSNYRPTSTTVAALIRARTRDANGILLGDFTDDGRTTPTRAQVEQEIDQAMKEAYPVFGDTVQDAPGSDPDALRKSAQAVVSARAAALVERGYFQQELDRGSSPYPQLMDDWNTGLSRVGKALGEANVGDTVGRSDDQVMAVGEFPDDTPYASGMNW
jgi:hypothetical protein